MRRGTAAWLYAILALAIGCGGKNNETPAGSERGPCYVNASCDLGLTCLSKVCVHVDIDAGGDTNPSTGTAGGGGSTGGGTGMAGGGGRGGNVDGGGTGGTFAVASHPPQPQVANLGGPVLTAPKVRPIFFAGDPDEAAMKGFLSEVAAGSYWAATTSEYGVGALTVLPAISGLTAPGGTVTDETLQSAIATNTASSVAPWGAADPSTIYLFILPPTVVLTFADQPCCISFGGYHAEANLNGALAVPYVAACACPDLLGAGWDPLDERTAALSHELIEAATDPFPFSDPAYSGANQANFVWSITTGGELTDMCTIQPDAYFRSPGAAHIISRSWSNAAARAGNDPCVPTAPPIPYFNSMPVLDVIPYGTSGYETHGLIIPVGTSRTIDLDLFSTGAVPHDWNVAAYAYEDFFGGTRSINLSMDKSAGHNGDIIRLTITALRTNPTVGLSTFVLFSTYGSPTDADYRSHVSMGLVLNN